MPAKDRRSTAGPRNQDARAREDARARVSSTVLSTLSVYHLHVQSKDY